MTPPEPILDTIGVVVADDDPVVRDGLAALFEAEPGIELVGSAAEADEAVELVGRLRPDVVILDVKMPGGGAQAARAIRGVAPQTRILALSAYEDRSTVIEMLRAGASGYLVKGTRPSELVDGIERCVRGQSALSAEVTADVVDELVVLLDRSEGMTNELEDLDRVKSELIQIISHEILTPITTIRGSAELLVRRFGDLGRAEAEDLLEGMTRAANRVRRMVADVAATARLGRTAFDLPTRPVPLSELVGAALAEFPEHRDRIRDRSNGAGSLRVWADVGLATRAIGVLVDNALSVSPPDTSVLVTAHASEDDVVIEVIDRGPGIPEDLRDRVFGLLTQADQSMTRAHDGLGIGLYLARRIMEAHRGRVEHLPHDGGGSIFRLTFPGLIGADTE